MPVDTVSAKSRIKLKRIEFTSNLGIFKAFVHGCVCERERRREGEGERINKTRFPAICFDNLPVGSGVTPGHSP